MNNLQNKIGRRSYEFIDEGNSQNEIGHWANDESVVAVLSWLWVRVELMPW